MNKTFNGEALSELRKKRQLSLERLARQLDYKFGVYTSHTTLAMYESNKVQNPSFTLVANLADLFEVKLDYFVKDKVN